MGGNSVRSVEAGEHVEVSVSGYQRLYTLCRQNPYARRLLMTHGVQKFVALGRGHMYLESGSDENTEADGMNMLGECLTEIRQNFENDKSVATI